MQKRSFILVMLGVILSASVVACGMSVKNEISYRTKVYSTNGVMITNRIATTNEYKLIYNPRLIKKLPIGTRVIVKDVPRFGEVKGVVEVTKNLWYNKGRGKYKDKGQLGWNIDGELKGVMLDGTGIYKGRVITNKTLIDVTTGDYYQIDLYFEKDRLISKMTNDFMQEMPEFKFFLLPFEYFISNGYEAIDYRKFYSPDLKRKMGKYFGINRDTKIYRYNMDGEFKYKGYYNNFISFVTTMKRVGLDAMGANIRMNLSDKELIKLALLIEKIKPRVFSSDDFGDYSQYLTEGQFKKAVKNNGYVYNRRWQYLFNKYFKENFPLKLKKEYLNDKYRIKRFKKYSEYGRNLLLQSASYYIGIDSDEYSPEDIGLELIKTGCLYRNKSFYFHGLAESFGNGGTVDLSKVLEMIDAQQAWVLMQSDKTIRVAVFDQPLSFKQDNISKNIMFPIAYQNGDNVSVYSFKNYRDNKLTINDGIYDFRFADKENDLIVSYDASKYYGTENEMKGIWLRRVTQPLHSALVSSIIASDWDNTDLTSKGLKGIGKENLIRIIPFSVFTPDNNKEYTDPAEDPKPVHYTENTLYRNKGVEWLQYRPMKSYNTKYHFYAALKYILEHNDVLKIRLINASFGWDSENNEDDGEIIGDIRDLLNKLRERGVIVFAAAGNDGINADNEIYPYGFEDVVGVIAHEQNYEAVTKFNYGDKAEFIALGASDQNGKSVNDVTAYAPTLSGSFHQITSFWGTSMAAPIVTAVAGNVLSEAEYWGVHLSADDLLDILKNGAKHQVYDSRVGKSFPAVNLEGSIRYFYEHYIPKPYIPVALGIKEKNEDRYFVKYYWKGGDVFSKHELFYSMRNHNDEDVTVTLALDREFEGSEKPWLILYDVNHTELQRVALVTKVNKSKIDGVLSVAGDSSSVVGDVGVYEADIEGFVMKDVASVAIANPSVFQNPGSGYTPQTKRQNAVYFYGILHNNANPVVRNVRVKVKGGDEKSSVQGNQLSLYDLKKGDYTVNIEVNDESLNLNGSFVYL